MSKAGALEVERSQTARFVNDYIERLAVSPCHSGIVDITQNLRQPRPIEKSLVYRQLPLASYNGMQERATNIFKHKKIASINCEIINDLRNRNTVAC
jgi:hypothetical protein